MANSREYGNGRSGIKEKGITWAVDYPLTYEEKFNSHVARVGAFKLCSNQHSGCWNFLFKDYISVLLLQISSLLYHTRLFLRDSQLFLCNIKRGWCIRSYALYVMCLPKSKFLLALGLRFLEPSATLFPTIFHPWPLVQAVRLYRHWEEIYQTRNKRIWSQEQVCVTFDRLQTTAAAL